MKKLKEFNKLKESGIKIQLAGDGRYDSRIRKKLELGYLIRIVIDFNLYMI